MRVRVIRKQIFLEKFYYLMYYQWNGITHREIKNQRTGHTVSNKKDSIIKTLLVPLFNFANRNCWAKVGIYKLDRLVTTFPTRLLTHRSENFRYSIFPSPTFHARWNLAGANRTNDLISYEK